MNNQANITEQQREKIVEYLDEARSKHMHLLYVCVAGSVLFLLPGLMLLGGYGGNRYSVAAGAAWFLCIIGTVVLFLTGYQKKFGKAAPIEQMKQHNFSCERITIAQLSDSMGKPPYLISDSLGKQYVCPIYLEFKQLQRGGNAIGIYLPDGTCFAVHDTSEDTY